MGLRVPAGVRLCGLQTSGVECLSHCEGGGFVLDYCPCMTVSVLKHLFTQRNGCRLGSDSSSIPRGQCVHTGREPSGAAGGPSSPVSYSGGEVRVRPPTPGVPGGVSPSRALQASVGGDKAIRLPQPPK